jgi:hypothetical protein
MRGGLRFRKVAREIAQKRLLGKTRRLGNKVRRSMLLRIHAYRRCRLDA